MQARLNKGKPNKSTEKRSLMIYLTTAESDTKIEGPARRRTGALPEGHEGDFCPLISMDKRFNIHGDFCSPAAVCQGLARFLRM
jgi:hypothetical protein